MKHIIFDYGNVLVKWDPRGILVEMGHTEAEIALLLPGIFDPVRWEANDAGLCSAEAYATQCCAFLPPRLHAAAQKILSEWYTHLPPIAGMAELISAVKKQGYGIYLLSNIAKEFAYHPEYVPAYTCFDGMVFSGVEQVVKPGTEIFCRLLDRYGLSAKDCLFIDDRQANIDAAISLGMDGYLFDGDVKRLQAYLLQ